MAKKQVPDPERIMKNYVTAYEQGLGSLDHEDRKISSGSLAK